MKAFWLSYMFCHAATFFIVLVTEDIIQAAGIAFFLSIAVYVFFECFYFEDETKVESQVIEHEDEYITLFTWK